MSESRKTSNWGRRRRAPDRSRWGRRHLGGSLAVLLPLAVLAAAILPSSAMAQLSGTTISGTVYNATTTDPMSGVTVTAIDATTPANGGQTVTTDGSGDYAFSGLTSGD